MSCLDPRYTITREYCGHDTPRWVARFCGDWIGQSKNAAGARELVREHEQARVKEMSA